MRDKEKKREWWVDIGKHGQMVLSQLDCLLVALNGGIVLIAKGQTASPLHGQ